MGCHASEISWGLLRPPQCCTSRGFSGTGPGIPPWHVTLRAIPWGTQVCGSAPGRVQHPSERLCSLSPPRLLTSPPCVHALSRTGSAWAQRKTPILGQPRGPNCPAVTLRTQRDGAEMNAMLCANLFGVFALCHPSSVLRFVTQRLGQAGIPTLLLLGPWSP